MEKVDLSKGYQNPKRKLGVTRASIRGPQNEGNVGDKLTYLHILKFTSKKSQNLLALGMGYPEAWWQKSCIRFLHVPGNRYPVNGVVCCVNTYSLNKPLSTG